MTQRVNIQYSVKIDELEQEVERLTQKAWCILEGCVSNNTLCSPVLSIEAHEQIDRLRLSLGETDAILADVSVIISSFLSYKSQQMMQSVPRPAHPVESGEEENSVGASELSELQEKIANFKNKLVDVENSSENDADIR